MITVTVTSPRQRESALSLLFSQFSETERIEHVKEVLEAVERKELSLDGLILAEIDGVPVGAASGVRC